MRQYHVQLELGEVSPYVLLPGSPDRVEKMAQLLENPRFVRQNREYCTWSGSYQGLPVSIVSTGIGGPSAAIAMEELIQLGCHTFIRTGTCGVLQNSMKRGDFIIATASVRGGATANAYVPIGYPAVADFSSVCALQNAAKNLKLNHHIGIIHCKDAFFLEDPQIIPRQNELENDWLTFQRSNVLGTEMESDTLFVIASIRKVRMGTILLGLGGRADNAPLQGSTPEHITNMTRCALEALLSLSKND